MSIFFCTFVEEIRTTYKLNGGQTNERNTIFNKRLQLRPRSSWTKQRITRPQIGTWRQEI